MEYIVKENATDLSRLRFFIGDTYDADIYRLDAYGNLESASEYEYIDECKSYIDDIIDAVIKNKDDCDFDSKITEILESEDQE